MPIKVICVCGKKFSVKDELVGKKVKCPACQKVLNLSKAAAEKLSPKDQRDFDESGNAQDQALEQFAGMKSSGADDPATSKRKSTGDDAARRKKQTSPEPRRSFAFLKWHHLVVVIGAACGFFLSKSMMPLTGSIGLLWLQWIGGGGVAGALVFGLGVALYRELGGWTASIGVAGVCCGLIVSGYFGWVGFSKPVLAAVLIGLSGLAGTLLGAVLLKWRVFAAGRDSFPSDQQAHRMTLRWLSMAGSLLGIVLLNWLVWQFCTAFRPGASLLDLASHSPHTSFTQFTDGTEDSAVTFGSGQTLLAGTVSESRAVPWTKPDDLDFDATFQTNEENSFVTGPFMFSNGSVQHLYIQDGLDRAQFRALFTISGHEPISLKNLRLYPADHKLFDLAQIQAEAQADPMEYARQAQVRSKVMKSLKAIVVALHAYHHKHQHLPPATIYGPDRKPWHSWRVLILPFLGQQALYDKYDHTVPWDDLKNAAVLESIPDMYRDPQSETPQDTHTRYLVITGTGTGFPTLRYPRTSPSIRRSSAATNRTTGGSGGSPLATRPQKKMLLLAGHKSLISNVAFNSDWTRLATASWDKTIKVWDGTTAKELLTLTNHTDAVRRVVFSPDGKWLASASADKSVKLWDAASGQELRTLNGHNAAVTSVTFSPDGQRLASASEDKSVKLWEVMTGRELLTLTGDTEPITSVAFSPDGKRLATAANDVRVWDVTSGQEQFTLKGHLTMISSMAFRADGQQLATASYDMTVKLWDTTSGQETHSLIGHAGAVMGMVYRPDGQRLTSSGVDMKLKEWDSASGRLCRTIQSTAGGSLTFSSDGKRLAMTNVGGAVEIWDNLTEQPVPAQNGHTGMVTSVAFSPDGQRLASASWDQTVKVWNSTTGQETQTLKGHDGPVGRVTFRHDGTSLLSATQQVFRTGAVKLWDANSGHETRTLEVPVTSVVAINEEGTRIASPSLALIASVPAGKELALKVWDATSGQELLALKGHSGPISSIALSRDGQWLASAGGTFQKPGEIKVWNVSNGQEARQWATPSSGSTRVAISPDGKRLAESNPDRTVKVWETSSGQGLVAFKGHEYQASSMAFSPDGKWLATGSGLLPSLPGEMKLWDAATGKEKLTLKGHKFGISCLTFSPDGKRLASASNDETVKVWDTTTGRELLRLGVPAQ